MLLTMSDDSFNSKYNQAILSFLYSQNSNVKNRRSNPPVSTKTNINSKSDELNSAVVKSLEKDANSPKISHESTSNFDFPIISDTLKTEEIESKTTQPLVKPIEILEHNLKSSNESTSNFDFPIISDTLKTEEIESKTTQPLVKPIEILEHNLKSSNESTSNFDSPIISDTLKTEEIESKTTQPLVKPIEILEHNLKSSNESTSNFDSPIISDTLKTEEIESKTTQPLVKPIEILEHNLKSSNESTSNFDSPIISDTLKTEEIESKTTQPLVKPIEILEHNLKSSNESTSNFDSPIISDTLKTEEIESKITQPLIKPIEILEHNLKSSNETEFSEKGKLARRNWQSIDVVGTFILKESNYKGHQEALSYFQKQSTFDQYSMNNERFYSIQFDLLKEDDFSNILNVTTKVRKYTEVEIEGNYLNPTELNLALWLFRSKSEIEFQQRLATAINRNSSERVENALEIKKYLEVLKSTSSTQEIQNATC